MARKVKITNWLYGRKEKAAQGKSNCWHLRGFLDSVVNNRCGDLTSDHNESCVILTRKLCYITTRVESVLLYGFVATLPFFNAQENVLTVRKSEVGEGRCWPLNVIIKISRTEHGGSVDEFRIQHSKPWPQFCGSMSSSNNNRKLRCSAREFKWVVNLWTGTGDPSTEAPVFWL